MIVCILVYNIIVLNYFIRLSLKIRCFLFILEFFDFYFDIDYFLVDMIYSL